METPFSAATESSMASSNILHTRHGPSPRLLYSPFAVGIMLRTSTTPFVFSFDYASGANNTRPLIESLRKISAHPPRKTSSAQSSPLFFTGLLAGATFACVLSSEDFLATDPGRRPVSRATMIANWCCNRSSAPPSLAARSQQSPSSS